MKQATKWKTREVMVGKVGVGGQNPVRIQSMTTSSTHDVDATIEQILRLEEFGCEIARVTVQGMKEAHACEAIKNGLVKRGSSIPLVADIHFFPPAALTVADFVDKVRINPGNFADPRATFKQLGDKSYESGLERIRDKFAPLVEKCKRLKRSMRIGVNHGSLSDRVMNRHGDTAKGMVISALEYTEIARSLGYHDIIYSMKSSIPLVMIEAYRLLVKEMLRLGWDYPLHLGVTEAGEGIEGRVKSSIGIGSLLADGIGDTIRISLTEDPWFEIDPATRLVRFAKRYERPDREPLLDIDPSSYRVPVDAPLHRDGSVMLTLSRTELEEPELLAELGCKKSLGRWQRSQESVDAVVIGKGELSPSAKKNLESIEKAGIALLFEEDALICTESEASWQPLLKKLPPFVFFASQKNSILNARKFFNFLKEKGLKVPVILRFKYEMALEDLIIFAGSEIGSLLADGMGEGVLLEAGVSVQMRRELAFHILQGARRRNFKTEFISCPGCGRTLFDLQKVAAAIREKTSHLPGVKIAIMGCIVNGPGEMADADFGYVGSKPGKVDLYIGKKCVEPGIAMEEAVDKLINLIKAEGRWVEKEEAALPV